jgi:hypothetical protein
MGLHGYCTGPDSPNRSGEHVHIVSESCQGVKRMNLFYRVLPGRPWRSMLDQTREWSDQRVGIVRGGSHKQVSMGT